MITFLDDFVNRLFERETIVVIAAFVFLYTGRITSVEEAVTLITTVLGILAQRGYVKGVESKEATAETIALSTIPMGAPLPRG